MGKTQGLSFHASSGANGKDIKSVCVRRGPRFLVGVKAFEMADDAKASVLCTLLIATADGRVNYELPPDEPQENPFE